MFNTIYLMFGGELGELPRRRPAPAIAFDPSAGGFVSVDADPVDDVRWLGRGEVPGQAAREAQTTAAGELTLAEEMQRLATERATLPE